MLTFRVNPQGPEGEDTHVYFYLNDTIVVDQVFNTGVHRAWQEIIEADILTAESNSLHVLAIGNEILISDVVLFYRRNV